MITLGIICFFVWLITSFIVVVDIFKKSTAIGCLGFLLLPIVPFYWVVKGYSGNKKLVGIVLFSSAIIAFGSLGYQFHSASSRLEPMIQQATKEGFDFSLTTVGTSGGNKYYTLVSNSIYTPMKKYSNTEEMLKVILKEKVKTLSGYYPMELDEGTIVKLAIHTESGFVAVYEITGPNEFGDIYVSNPDDL